MPRLIGDAHRRARQQPPVSAEEPRRGRGGRTSKHTWTVAFLGAGSHFPRWEPGAPWLSLAGKAGRASSPAPRGPSL